MKIKNDQMRVGKRPWNQLSERNGWTDGVVVTPHGYVSVYAQGDENNPHVSSVSIIKDGVRYQRSYWGKRYTQRGLVTLASRFAREVFSG